jgi:hypothetical protein
MPNLYHQQSRGVLGLVFYKGLVAFIKSKKGSIHSSTKWGFKVLCLSILIDIGRDIGT